MRILIIDDEPQAIDVLRNQLATYSYVSSISAATTGMEGLRKIKETAPDVLFLDIELPDITGLSFLERMGTLRVRCDVVVYSAHSKYMLPAFRQRAFDFLLKPLNDQELDGIMQRLCTHQLEKNGNKSEEDAGSPSNNILFYTNSTDFKIINRHDICLFRFNRDLRCWEAIAASNPHPLRLLRRQNKDAILANDTNFVQVSKNYIINVCYLQEVVDDVCHFYPPFEHILDVKVSRLYRQHIVDSYL